MGDLTKDKQAPIAVKKVNIARSGMQVYTADEIAARGLTPKVPGKQFYIEYRPPEVLLKAKNLFNYAYLVPEHTPVDVDSSNYRNYMVGVIGNTPGVEVNGDNEIFITNEVAFYDNGAYNDYLSGKKEVSAGYSADSKPVDNPDEVGYDFIMQEIKSVNHVAMCDTGTARAGHNARISDTMVLNQLGGKGMGKTVAELIGLKRRPVTFSGTVFDSLNEVKKNKFSEDSVAKEAKKINDTFLASLGDSKEKETLKMQIADCFTHVDSVLEKEKEIGATLDEAYDECKKSDRIVADRLAAKKVSDEGAGAGGEELDEPGKKTDDSTEGPESAKQTGAESMKKADIEKLVKDTVASSVLSKEDVKSIVIDALKEVGGKEEKSIEDSVKKILNIQGGSLVEDSSEVDTFDSSMLDDLESDNIWGQQ